MTPDVPPPLAPLSPLIGDWAHTMTFPEDSGIPEMRGWTSFEWLLDGRFLLQRSGTDHPAAPSVHSLIGVDPRDESKLTQHHFDSRGVIRLYAVTFEDGALQLLRDTPDFSPLDFSQRFRGELQADGSAMTGQWEATGDDGEWRLDFHLTYRR